MISTPTLPNETVLGDLLAGVLTRFAGAIEFWTPVCLSPGDIGDADAFVDDQSTVLRDQIQELRAALGADDFEPPEAVLEQLAKLAGASAELREVFDFFITSRPTAEYELEAAVLRLATIWQEVRMRVWLIGALIPLPVPPALATEKEAYYQAILDGLFDQLVAARTSLVGELHERNGKV